MKYKVYAQNTPIHKPFFRLGVPGLLEKRVGMDGFTGTMNIAAGGAPLPHGPSRGMAGQFRVFVCSGLWIRCEVSRQGRRLPSQIICSREKLLGYRHISATNFSLMDSPLFAIPAPVGGGGVCDSSVVPGCLILVLQRHRNRGTGAAGRNPGSVIHYQERLNLKFKTIPQRDFSLINS